MSYNRGILDDTWQKQQNKTFTAWCNAQLSKTGLKVENIGEDFKDGILLLRLLEVIANVQLKRPEKGTLRVHRIQNLNYALQFIKERKVPLTGISAEELNDGNLKLTLGLIWMLILKFQIEEISVEELTAKEGLLLWCQKNTRGYERVNVQSFTKSFQDGLAFCALINKFHPDKLDYSKLDYSNKSDNLNLAFQVAEEQLGIAKLLDAQDMLESDRNDERSVMTYVASYYHAFASSKKVTLAADRVDKVLSFALSIQELEDQFVSSSSLLARWIQDNIAKFSNKDLHDDLIELQQKLDEYRNYRQNDKVQKAEEKGRLEFAYNQLQLRLRLNNRSPFVAHRGQSPQEIDDIWVELEKAEREYSARIRQEIIRQTKLGEIDHRLRQQLNSFSKWFSNINDNLESIEVDNAQLNTVMAYQKQMDLVTQEIEQQQNRLQVIDKTFSAELRGYKNFNTLLNSINENSANLQKLIVLKNAKIQQLEEKRALLEKLDQLKLEFALTSANVRSWIADAKDGVLLSSIRTFSVGEAEQIHKIFNVFKQELDNIKFNNVEGLQNVSKGALYYKALDIHAQLEQAGDTSNEYSSYSIDELRRDWKELEDLTVKREQDLLKEIERQHHNETTKVAYQALAKEIMAVIDSGKQQVKLVLGTSEQQKSALTKIQNDLLHGKAMDLLAQADGKSAEMDKEGVQDDSLVINIDTLHEHFDQLAKLIERQIGDVNNQIATRDMTGVTDEQLLEFKSSFNHFDRQNSGKLDRLAFRACLLSLGVNLPDVKAGDNDAVFEGIMRKVDKQNSGFVTFESLVDYMSKEAAFTDTLDQVVESFRTLANDKPTITKEQLQKELPSTRVAKFIEMLEPYRSDDGSFDYEAFAHKVYAP